jgi:hypothetical protein
MISREEAGNEVKLHQMYVMVVLTGQTDMEAYAEGEAVWE